VGWRRTWHAATAGGPRAGGACAAPCRTAGRSA
jgi:hypothetical protein